MKRGAMMLLVTSLVLGVTGCSDDDPNYDNVTPPEVAVAPNTLTGIITSINGDAVANATITLGSDTNTSDKDGVFLFSDVEAGTYTIRVEAEGKLPKEAEITVADSPRSQNLVWNATLFNDIRKEVSVSANESTVGNVVTEALKGNDLAEVNVEADVPAGAVETAEDEDVKIVISPIYDAGSVSGSTKTVTRAGESVLLLGVSMSCSNTAYTLAKPVELGFSVDEEVAQNVEARQYKDGRWVAVASRIEDGKVIIEADEFTAYGLFLGVSFSASSSSEAISFEQDEWNNLYGAKDMEIGSASYTCKAGTEIETKGTDVLTALLIEKLAQRYGATASAISGSYPLNVTLPIGTVLTISGSQNKQNVSVSALGKSASGTHYGVVSVAVVTYNRQHNGGTSGTL